MARATPSISENTLSCPAAHIPVESDAWWDWLTEDSTSTFRFESSDGRFTARRERKHTGYYWYAYRKHDGKLRKAYLGKTKELTLQRLHEVAESLARMCMASPGECPEDVAQTPIHEKRDSSFYHAQLLDTKLSIPAVRTSLVRRPRLMERLHQVEQCRLLLITAPAGSGKTTLLSEWWPNRQGNESPLAWVSLDSGDNDPMRFWGCCIAALAKISPEVRHIGEQAQHLLRSPQPGAIETVLTALINSVSNLSRDIVLALDDYHLITSQTIQEGLTFLLDHLPPRLHLILACRTEPPLPLARWRVRGQIAALNAADLRFTFAETEAFLRQVMGLSLSDEQIDILERRTEGWIAGLQLAALSLQEHTDPAQFIAHFTGSHRHVMDYLIQEVLHQQSEAIQCFLLYTSILERLSGALCDAVMERTDSGQVLAQLEQGNLFLVPVDEARRWYRYHHLFAGALGDYLQQEEPRMMPVLHHRAAAWYERNHFVAEAIHHALAGDDARYAGRLIERNGELMFQRGEIMTLKAWLELLPEAVLQERPRLLLFKGGVSIAIGQFVEAEVRVREAKRAIDVLRQRAEAERDPEREAYCRKATSDLAAIETTMAAFQGDLLRALALYHHALTIVPEDDVFMRSIMVTSLATVYMLNGNIADAAQMLVQAKSIGQVAENTHVILAAIAAQAYLLMEQGCLRQAAEIYRQGIYLATRPDGQMFPAASIAFVGLGEILYQWNELAEADRYFEQGITLGETWGYVMFHARGYVIWARVKFAQGDEAGAQRVLQRLEQQALRYDILPALSWLKATQARLSLGRGDSKAAVQCIQGMGLKSDEPITYINEYEYMTLTRVFIARGNYDEALTLLARLLTMVEAEGRMRSTIEILTLQALAFDARGDAVQSQVALSRALLLAEPDGFIRTFVEEGAAMVALLMKFVAVQKRRQYQAAPPISLSYVGRLLEFLGVCIVLPAQEQARGIARSQLELLSERELTVLQHIAAGLSNAEIADEMVVAVSTIKWHIKHIYAKLQVHSRTQVVVKARELRLLSL